MAVGTIIVFNFLIHWNDFLCILALCCVDGSFLGKFGVGSAPQHHFGWQTVFLTYFERRQWCAVVQYLLSAAQYLTDICLFVFEDAHVYGGIISMWIWHMVVINTTMDFVFFGFLYRAVYYLYTQDRLPVSRTSLTPLHVFVAAQRHAKGCLANDFERDQAKSGF